MYPHPIFQDIKQLIAENKRDELQTLLQSELQFDELTLFKCDTCGEIVAVSPKYEWVRKALFGENPLIEYLIYSHMQENLSHSVTVDLGGGIKAPIGGLLMNQLRKAAELHGITLDMAFKKRLPYLKAKINDEQ